jgi:hypothetical protein
MMCNNNDSSAEHCAFVLSIVTTETTLANKLVRSLCLTTIKRFARRRLVEMCVGLQSLHLPAFVVCRIAANSEVCAHLRFSLLELWTVVTRVKHFL